LYIVAMVGGLVVLANKPATAVDPEADPSLRSEESLSYKAV
jgi:hypothetical protein